MSEPAPEPEASALPQVGQKLEAQDVQYPSLMCVATVSSVQRQGSLVSVGVSFDGWNSSYDYTDALTFEGFRPCGWCQANGKDLQVPGGLVQPPSGSWSSPFDWPGYLLSTGTQAVDAGLLVATTPRSSGLVPPPPYAAAVAAPDAAAASGGAAVPVTEEGWAALDRFAIRGLYTTTLLLLVIFIARPLLTGC
eukprot:COSAG05_NODE_334_length_11233_cov_697.826477_12_plen_193_part_00